MRDEGDAAMRVWVDGREVGAAAPAVSASDQGFTHGWAVFETLRIEGGRAPHVTRHAARLEAAARRLGRPQVDPRWRDDLAAALGATRLPHGAARVALTAGAAPGGPWSGAGGPPRRIVWIRPAAPAGEAPAVGSAVVRRPVAGIGPSALKTHAYVGAMVVEADARARGADAALWWGNDGCVGSAATANVFARFGDRLVTPPAGDTVRAGVTREIVCEVFARRGSPVTEQRLTRSALAGADEVFLTSSVRGVLALSHIDGGPLAELAPGPTARAAHAAWRATLNEAAASVADVDGVFGR
jgi:branched-subunit amino acid aminotransferase/4-amino-4-deoxychorismate lyase